MASNKTLAAGLSPSKDLLEDFWNEFKDIERSGSICLTDGRLDVEHENEDTETSGSKTPDEGEKESKWLKEAGYGHLVSEIESGVVVDVDEVLNQEFSSLTRQQAEAVKRRFETLHVVHSNKRQRHVDVRRIFSQPPEGTVQAGDSASAPVSPEFLRNSDQTKHKRRGSAKGQHIFKNRAEYNMTATGDDVVEEALATTGIETISIQPTGTIVDRDQPPHRYSISAITSVITDNEISFEIDEGGGLLTPDQKLEFGNRKPRDLPVFRLKEEPLGCTTINDLSNEDLCRIKSLALIELTAVFDSHHIVYYARKSKKKNKDTGVFGVSCGLQLEQDRRKQPNLRVPLFFKQIIDNLMNTCLHEEGLLRVPGSASRIKALRTDIEEKFQTGSFSWENVHPNDMAAILKQYLRELPSPLLTHEYLEAFALIENIADRKQQVKALNLLIILLPNTEQEMLKLLLRFLAEVIACEDNNKMNINNVSMIIAPNLFLSQSQGNRKSVIKDFEINMAAGTANIVRMLIKYQDILWTVPYFMITQIRHQYESEQIKKSRSIMKLLTKKDKSEAYKKTAILNEEDYQKNIIRVTTHAGSTTGKTAKPIQIDDKTTAFDVIVKFRQFMKVQNGAGTRSNSDSSINVRPRRPSFAKDLTHLYEIGGNIGERCLHHKTRMLALYHVNPNAEWVIKDVIS
ncbi:rho GTPase-activating protein 18-like [Tubulanus polymorphus]|uniref:rho GTPase-activating protein 18-like n=1 Tax=Tubulanus polymorphus TaxID=672921 RepID=UPI003DA4D942